MGGERTGVNPPGDDGRRGALANEERMPFAGGRDQGWWSRRARNPAEEASPRDRPGAGESEYGSTGFGGERLFSGPAAELFGDTAGGTDPAFRAVPRVSSESAGERSYPSYPSHPSLPSVPPPAPAETSGLVRPYFRTGGRTRPSQDLAVEALVSTSERGRALGRVRVAEHRSICSLCLDTRSVAEVAAYLRLPLGVVRVLIGDVAGLGLVLIHSATPAAGDRPSIEFMERVLSGLRRI